jgi:hypothetical protein
MSRARRGALAADRVAAALLALGSVLTGTALAVPQPAGAAPPSVRLTATIASTPAAEATERHPVALDPGEAVQLQVRIDNDTGDDLSVRSVRVEGRVMGLTFFSYDTRVGIEVPAHGTATRRYPLDLVGLRGQATGLIPARVVALDADRRPVASQDLVVDVRGSARSVYGAFGLAVAAFTAVSLAGALLALARHRLSPNRWRRAVRFTWPGIGIGLLLVFTLSAIRVFVPLPHRWVPLVAISTAALFVLGYVTPTPDEPEEVRETELEEDAHVDAPAAVLTAAITSRSGSREVTT